jgi:tetratricopeptide (TPR) repeat protein
MLKAWFRCWTVAGLLVLFSGCATDVRTMVAGLDQDMVAVELTETPFYPQVTDQCGPSALAATLNVSGVSVAPETLRSQIYIPGREGSLQIELLAATRGYQRIPYLIDPDVTALLRELHSGRPVLVLQNLGRKTAPVWHYAVVVGFLPDKKEFVLRSGDQQRHLVKAARFVRTWRRAGYWGMVTLLPGELPASPDASKYVRSVAAIESVGDAVSAAAGYQAATERWPENLLAWLGLGNARYAQGDLESAERAYNQLLRTEPNHAVALNNLSQVQAEQGYFEKAVATLDIALAATTSNISMQEIIRKTREEIGLRKSTAACL